MPEHHHAGSIVVDLLPALPLLIALSGYLTAVALVRRRRPWPPGRTALWCTGLVVIAVAVLGPLAARAHHDLTAHMVGHLLLGMLAPLLLVRAAPLTLALRALPVRWARRLARLLASAPLRVLTHPVTAGALDLGGLWLLYTTDLYRATNDHPALHLGVHAHVLLAGYLFTAALVGVDPAPHRSPLAVRAAVLVAFLAAHAILAKHLYAHPPTGVPAADARSAGLLMYYGGDLIDLVLITLLCRQWYVTTRPHEVPPVPIGASHPG